MDLVRAELARAYSLHRAFPTHHHACSVILAEFEELKSELWKKSAERDPQAVIAEAVQVAAMAMRTILDLHGGAL
jgi:hypothetical protein